MTAPNAELAYRVTFDRIGRNHNVSALVAQADGPNHLADQILAHARPHLMSRDISVAFEEDMLSGWIFAGVRTASTFKIERPESYGTGCRCDWLGGGTPEHAPSALCRSLRPDADRDGEHRIVTPSGAVVRLIPADDEIPHCRRCQMPNAIGPSGICVMCEAEVQAMSDRWSDMIPNPHPLANCGPLSLPLPPRVACPRRGTLSSAPAGDRAAKPGAVP